MDRGGVDHDAEDTPASIARRATATRSSSEASAARRGSSRRRAGAAQVRRGASATATGRPSGRGPRGRGRGARRRGRRQVGVGPACSHREVAPPPRSAIASAFSRSGRRRELDPDVATAGSGGPGVGTDLVGERRRTQWAEARCRRGSSGELRPYRVVAVVVGQPSGLAEHRGGRLLPVGARRGGSGSASARCPGRAPARSARGGRPRRRPAGSCLALWSGTHANHTL